MNNPLSPVREIADPALPFSEAALWCQPTRTLGLSIKGTRLEPVLAEFVAELLARGIQKPKPHFYLADEWGVPFDTVSIAMPFYLARPDLIDLHLRHNGFVEGATRADLLRYLRHEMGHVINYAYRLYDEEAWVTLFGSITQPYEEEYRPEPFSPRFVRHLPGWYGQKHPDEDWAETFAVWLTPDLNWREEYGHWPVALEKLEYCERTMTALRDREPLVTATETEDEVGWLPDTLQEFYREAAILPEEMPRGLDGALRTIFEDVDEGVDQRSPTSRQPASSLIRRYEHEITANVFRWTGHFPERTQPLLRQLALRADVLRQVFAQDREATTLLALTVFVTALAMNYVCHGNYVPAATTGATPEKPTV